MSSSASDNNSAACIIVSTNGSWSLAGLMKSLGRVTGKAVGPFRVLLVDGRVKDL